MEVNLFTIFATMVNFIILILILKHFLFDRINRVIEDRNYEIEESLNYAKTKNLEAEELRDSFEKQIAEIEAKGLEIIRKARAKADDQGRDIVREAEEKADQLLKQTAEEIEREKLKALEEMKHEIAALAIAMAEKILEKQLDHQEQQAIIGRIIDETGNAKWQN